MKRPNFYAASPLDRGSRFRKNEAWLSERLSDPASQFVIVWNFRNLLCQNEEGPRALFMRFEAVKAILASRIANPILLGVTGEAAYFALDINGEEPPLAAFGLMDEARFVFSDLRLVGAAMPGDEAATLAHARGLIYWHSRHMFCGVCGSPTVSAEAGNIRICDNPDCAVHHFPRTDPAVIMLVHDGDRCLLGRQTSWPAGMYSTLAGFVEPGESLEETVTREVMEEVGVAVRDVTYHSSQPWPFPSSIMLGFYAAAESNRIEIDFSEIEDARWFTRDEVRNEVGVRVPPRSSIARRLIDDWVAGCDGG